jgi:hypothetical protein
MGDSVYAMVRRRFRAANFLPRSIASFIKRYATRRGFASNFCVSVGQHSNASFAFCPSARG